MHTLGMHSLAGPGGGKPGGGAGTNRAPKAGAGLTRRAALAGAAVLAGGAVLSLAGCGTAGSAGSAAAGSAGPAGSAAADAGSASLSAAASAGAGTAASTSSASPTSASASDELASRVFFAFDTIVTVKGVGITGEMFDQLAAACQRYDGLLSAQTEGSDVARINEAGGKPVEVDPDTADCIARSLEVCELFDGSFDITIGSVSLLWDFQNGVKPADDAIAEAVGHVDYHGVTVDGTTVTLADPKAKIDLGGSAKGWIADRLTRMLADWGIDSAIVDLGSSSIYALGTKPGGALWRLGLRDPVSPDGSPLGVIEVADRAVVTSGLYDQHFEQDGVDYCHILDPRTGYPVETDILALTAVLGDSMLGDGLTTAFFVLGAEGARKWVADHPDRDVEAVFIDDNDQPHPTEGFEGRYAFAYSGGSAGSAGSAAGGSVAEGAGQA